MCCPENENSTNSTFFKKKENTNSTVARLGPVPITPSQLAIAIPNSYSMFCD
jgi:hypothetical protein